MKNITIFGKEIIDPKAIQQLENCMIDDSIGVLTADAHYGYQHPIGGAIAYKNHISISGVGYDIGCGNKAVRTALKYEDCKHEMSKIMDEVVTRISFGVGRKNNKKIDHPIIDEILQLSSEEPEDFNKNMLDVAISQLGTVGSGNHFIDLFADQDGYIWIGVHFGSRGFGHKTATGFMALSQGLKFHDKPRHESMDGKPILLRTDQAIGQYYMHCMHIAGQYAHSGRDIVVNQVLDIFGNPEITLEVHNHHNFAWKEQHYGEDYWVVRKGCTPLSPNQLSFIGSNMRDCSVIVEGIDGDHLNKSLRSTVHGAGRIMSRTQAAGKKKWMRGEDVIKRPTTVTPGKINFMHTQDPEEIFQLICNL